jgi:hypothetical protein
MAQRSRPAFWATGAAQRSTNGLAIPAWHTPLVPCVDPFARARIAAAPRPDTTALGVDSDDEVAADVAVWLQGHVPGRSQGKERRPQCATTRAADAGVANTDAGPL